MMKKLAIWMFFGLIPMMGFAAILGDVSGKIIESASKRPLDFVNVAILKKDGSVVKGAVTATDGSFVIKDLPVGSYKLQVSSIGFTKLELPIVLTNAKPNLTVGSLTIQEDSKVLGEVNVVGQKSMMRLEVDKKVFDVSQSIAAAGAAADEVLRNIPSVEVDIEGNISLRNNTNVEVWINGRPSGLTAENRAQILAQMPAESIESVEVITNPSAKFSPEGSAGIINIVLKKERKLGYFGSVAAGGDTFGGYNVSANVNATSSNFDAYLNVGYRANSFPRNESSTRQSWSGDDTTTLITNGDGKMSRGGLFLRAGYTHHLTDKDHLGINLMGMTNDHSMSSVYNYQSFMPNNSDPLSFFRKSDSKSPMLMGNVSLDYTHDFSKDESLRVNFSYNPFSNDGSRLFEQSAPNSSIITLQDQQSTNSRERYELQLDWTKNLFKGNKLEVGYKGSYSNNEQNVDTKEGLDVASMVSKYNMNSDYSGTEQNHALYATFSGKVKKLTYQAGLRGEYLEMNNKDVQFNDEGTPETMNYRSEFPGLFPSLFLTYNFAEGNDLQLNYTRRVDRPRGRSMRPAKDYSDALNISWGNPNLKPVYSDSYELNYLKSWGAQTLSSSLYYKTAWGNIQNVSYVDGGVKYSTYENIGNSYKSGLELIGKNTIARILNLTTTVNLFYYKMDGYTYAPLEGLSTTYLSTESFSWDVKLMASLLLPKAYALQVTGSYTPKMDAPQGSRDANYSIDLGARKSFFNKKLTVSLSVRDLFDSRKWSGTSFGNSFSEQYSSQFGGRMGSLTLTYNFGNGAQSKKAKAKPVDSNTSMDSDMMDY